MIWTRSRSISMPSVACTTCIAVRALSKSTNRLSRLDSRCCTIRNAIPLFEGNASKSFLQASRPPAEIPIATIKKSAVFAAVSGPRIQRCRAALPGCGRLVVISALSEKEIPYQELREL